MDLQQIEKNVRAIESRFRRPRFTQADPNNADIDLLAMRNYSQPLFSEYVRLSRLLRAEVLEARDLTMAAA
jgi:7,8-dihydro-6-hydroxymethylpterin-pyrophosphokinase